MVNAVPIGRWAYRGLLLGNEQRMAQCDNSILKYLRDTLVVEKTMNRLRVTIDVRQGCLRLSQLWLTFVTGWVSLGQNEVR